MSLRTHATAFGYHSLKPCYLFLESCSILIEGKKKGLKPRLVCFEFCYLGGFCLEYFVL